MYKIISALLFLTIICVCIRCIPQKEILPTYGSKQFILNSSNPGNPTYLITTVTIDGSIVAAVSNYGSYSNCNSSNSVKIVTGNHTYEAYSTDKTMRWTGTFSVTRNSCENFFINESEGLFTGSLSTATGSNVISDISGIQVYLTWATSPSSSPTTNYADFDLGISTSLIGSYTNYDFSTNSSSFETCQIYGSSSSTIFYVNISLSYINSNFSATCSLQFSGLNNPSIRYSLPLSGTYYNYSSNSYFPVAKVQRSGNSYTIIKYP